MDARGVRRWSAGGRVGYAGARRPERDPERERSEQIVAHARPVTDRGSSSARPTASRVTPRPSSSCTRARPRRRAPARGAASQLQVGARGEQRALAGPPLRETDHLAPAVEHLAGPTAGEAHQVTELTGDGAAGVDVEAGLPLPGQGVHPPGADPLGGGGDIGHPQGVVPRDPGVQPELAGRLEIRPLLPRPAAGPSRRRAGAARAGSTSSVGCVLPSTSVGRVTSRASGQPTGLGTELLDLEERLRRGQPQEAAARYGSHSGSTSERWRSRHRCPSGGAGLTRSVQPSSESN